MSKYSSGLFPEAQYKEAWEVKSAGEGRGFGLFATRDVKAGEVVLCDWTSIILNDDTDHSKVTDIISRYTELAWELKEAWRNLALYSTQGRFLYLERFLDRYRRPNGKALDIGEKSLYLQLWLIVLTNSFEVKRSKCGLFLDASRFNHSCDPNIWYDCTERFGRWLGRANRNIKKGEEFTISYIPYHMSRAERLQEAKTNWGFECDCQKCAGGPDKYTAELVEACDIANGFEPDRAAEPPKYKDDLESRRRLLLRRAELLRRIVNKTDEDKSRSRSKELVYALWDLAGFHHHQYMTIKGPKRTPEERQHLEMFLGFTRDALDIARTIWPEQHEMVATCRKDYDYARSRKMQDFPDTGPASLDDDEAFSDAA